MGAVKVSVWSKQLRRLPLQRKKFKLQLSKLPDPPSNNDRMKVLTSPPLDSLHGYRLFGK